jgi:hypothetical protein
MNDTKDGAPSGFELLRADFAGLYAEHSRANSDFSTSRLRAILAVESVPMLALGRLSTNCPGHWDESRRCSATTVTTAKTT